MNTVKTVTVNWNYHNASLKRPSKVSLDKPNSLDPVKYGEYYSCGRDIYIVSRFDTNMYGLICINTGNRWTAPVKAEDSHDIPITIFTGDEKLFKKVKVSIKTEGK